MRDESEKGTGREKGNKMRRKVAFQIVPCCFQLSMCISVFPFLKAKGRLELW